MSVYSRLLSQENLNFAWIKAKNIYRAADGFIDAGEVASFELDLENRLLDIRRQFERGTYRPKKIRPLPRPKRISEELQSINRQYYHVAIEDQVAWIAVVNALGPELDLKMESWSYGNRLYRPAWYEKDEVSGSTLEIGPYRHASGHLYRKFQHSWPLFRRHVTLTARMMALRRNLRNDEMDQPDQLAAASAQSAKLAYFQPGFWPQQDPPSNKTDLYHASIDLKQFFPTLKVEAVIKGLADAGAMAEPQIATLVTGMLNFRIDTRGMPDTALENVDPAFLKGAVTGIPTGLFVAGFLANAAMLPVDRKVALKINECRHIAHFRFVDDHTLIAYNFDVLCDWILWYEKLLETQGIGPVVNPDKSDPPSLSKWMDKLKMGTSPVELRAKDSDLYNLAMREARLDGKNPTKLMTKTLAQVSAMAAADIHILDDDDLAERLRMLEWLLLADIPDREIRPDTRAAFAAGQIASLVPVLVQEADGLVEAAREVAAHERRRPRAPRATEDDLLHFEEGLSELKKKLQSCIEQHHKDERALLTRCFELLLQSLREHPGKARLFYRIHQYCRVTGHKGLEAISKWLKETRDSGHDAWADYYAALSLQIMASGLFMTVRRLTTLDTLQSDIKAAVGHLEDIAGLDKEVFRVSAERETWYHASGRREFGVALIFAAETLCQQSQHLKLGRRLAELSQTYVSVAPGARADEWLAATGRTSGVWAHLGENSLGSEVKPSAAWSALAPHFDFEFRTDQQTARRYPELLSDAGWVQLLAATDPLPENDSAWLREVIGTDEGRRASALATGKNAFTRAARSLEACPQHWITIDEWTDSIQACSPFDPRRSEWTALEIVAQLLEEATSTGGDEAILDRIHPSNVLLPQKWITEFSCQRNKTELSWEAWRHLVRNSADAKGDFRVRLRDTRSSLADYRYAIRSRGGKPVPDAERRLASVGRLLLGLLRNDHAAPRIWNLRGNELIFRLPRARWFEALAISSPTTLIVEACLGARPAETRTIKLLPSLFGWREGEQPNDVAFDPPLFLSSTDLLEGVRHAQKVLEANQLAVARNQPRQLIPFRLADFSIGTESADATGGEGANDGE
jgi:hypothetical protein